MPKLSILDRYTKLSFPSSLVKKFMVSEIKNKSYVIDTVKEKNDKKDDKKEDNKTEKDKEIQFISVSNSHLIITKLIESLINYLITESVLYKTKSNVGLYELQYRDIETAIYKNNELKENFIYSVFNYQSDIHYEVIDNKELVKYLNDMDNNVKVENDAINFIQYLINCYCCKFIKIAYSIMKEYNKIRINSSIIKICLNVMFSGKYYCRIIKETEEMVSMIDSFREEKKQENEKKKEDKTGGNGEIKNEEEKEKEKGEDNSNGEK